MLTHYVKCTYKRFYVAMDMYNTNLTVWVGAVSAPQNHDAYHHGHH